MYSNTADLTSSPTTSHATGNNRKSNLLNSENLQHLLAANSTAAGNPTINKNAFVPVINNNGNHSHLISNYGVGGGSASPSSFLSNKLSDNSRGANNFVSNSLNNPNNMASNSLNSASAPFNTKGKLNQHGSFESMKNDGRSFFYSGI